MNGKFGEKIFLKNGTFIFEVDFLGKNIFDKLFGPYSKKPRGSPGEGVQGRGTWGIPGDLARLIKEKPPESVVYSLRRHVLAPLIHGN